MDKKERHLKLERLLASGKSQKEASEILGVDRKTVQRDVVEMRSQNKRLKSDIPYSEVMRDEVFERIMSTQDMIDSTIKDALDMARLLKEDIEGGEACECCGRKPLKASDLKWQSYFKGLDTTRAQLELRAKLLGEISDSPQLTIMQMDSDMVQVMSQLQALAIVGMNLAHEIRREYPELGEVMGPKRLGEFTDRLENIGPELARELYTGIVSKSARRLRRLPEFVDLVDGEYVLLEGEEE